MSESESTRQRGHSFVDGITDELIGSRADARTATEDLTHRINGVRERLAERISSVEQIATETRGAVRHQGETLAQVLALLESIERRLPPAT